MVGEGGEGGARNAGRPGRARMGVSCRGLDRVGPPSSILGKEANGPSGWGRASCAGSVACRMRGMGCAGSGAETVAGFGGSGFTGITRCGVWEDVRGACGVEVGDGDSDGVGEGDRITLDRARCRPRRKRGVAIDVLSSEESISSAESLKGL